MTQEKEDITYHIDFRFREYSFYVLTQRGIPSRYDALTDVQRIILTSAKNKLSPTNALIGDCISSGYHHGDSLAGAIAKLGRDYDNSNPLLVGDGFFGSAIGSASAPRYTKCKISDSIAEIISKYKNLNTIDFDGLYDYLHLDLPIGLCTTITGIGVGYSSFILPRKLDEISKFVISGKKADLTPYFKGFKGFITKSTNNKGNFAWLIQSNVTFDPNKKIIKIVDIPPMMRYDTSLEKLNDIISDFDISYKVSNLSKVSLDVEIKIIRGSNKDIDDLINKIKKFFSMTYTEQYVFTDKNSIIHYESIEDYLTDFKNLRQTTILKQLEFELNQLNVELEFNNLKLKFIDFIISIGKVKENTILSFLNDNTKNESLRDRIKRIPAYKINEDEIELTKNELPKIKSQIADQNILIENQKLNIDYSYKPKAKNLLKIES